MVMEIMLDMVIRVGLIVATAFLFSIIFLAYLRMKNRKMLLISLGFATFLVNALLHIPELISEDYGALFSENVFLFIHLVGLIFIAIGILKD
jgi:hypothetical protein